MENCKRLHDYSYFVACTRSYLGKGFGQKEAVVRATEECIEKGILEDVLRKHRAEVMDMFLTKFDKKMFYEALWDEGREEMAQKYEELSKDHEELIKNHARRLYESGVPYEVACRIVTEMKEEDLKKIYKIK